MCHVQTLGQEARWRLVDETVPLEQELGSTYAAHAYQRAGVEGGSSAQGGNSRCQRRRTMWLLQASFILPPLKTSWHVGAAVEPVATS